MALLSAFVDTFDGTSLSGDWSIAVDNPSGALQVSDHKCVSVIPLPIGSDSGLTDVISVPTFDFDSIFIEVGMDDFDAADQREFDFGVGTGTQGAGFYYWDTELRWFCQAASFNLYSATYDPVAHRWLKLTRDGSGIVHYWTAPDGTTWTELGTSSEPVDLAGHRIDLFTFSERNPDQYPNSTAGPTRTTWFANLNAAPSLTNDNFADAKTVSFPEGGSYDDVVDGQTATREPGEPYAIGSTHASHTVWYRYQPSSSGTAYVDTNGSYGIDVGPGGGGDTVLAVYTGTALDNLVKVASDDDGGSGGNSQLNFVATGGTTYWIQIGGYSNSDLIVYHLHVAGPGTGTPGQMTGVTATATADAYPAPYPPVSVNVDGVLAIGSGLAIPATEIRAYEWAALGTGEAYPAKPPNDDLADAHALSGAGGASTLNGLGATREAADEPPSFAAAPNAESVWLAYTPTVPGTFIFTAPSGHAAEIWEGTDYSDFAYVAGGTGTITTALASSIAYRIRILPTVTGHMALSVPYSWSYTERTADLALNVPVVDIDDTPVTIRASVLNGTADGPVQFHLDSTLIWTDAFDSTGVLADVEIPLPPVPAGTYNLVATDTTTSGSDSVTITIATDPEDDDDGLPEDTEPEINTAVTKWVVQDRSSGSLVSYTFPINPEEMTTPFPHKYLLLVPTTAPDGQPLTWEGAPRPHQWEFRGHIETQEFYDALAGFADSAYRYWLIDHRHRAWQVTFEAFEPTLRTRLDPLAPWRATYSMRCFTYKGPVTS